MGKVNSEQRNVENKKYLENFRSKSKKESRGNTGTKQKRAPLANHNQPCSSLCYLNKVKSDKSVKSSSSEMDKETKSKTYGRTPSRRLRRGRKPIHKTGSSGSLNSFSTDNSDKKSKRFRTRWWNQKARNKRPRFTSQFKSYQKANSKYQGISESSTSDTDVPRYCCKCGKVIPKRYTCQKATNSSSSDDERSRSSQSCRYKSCKRRHSPKTDTYRKGRRQSHYKNICLRSSNNRRSSYTSCSSSSSD